jgi:hypothetical protein
MLAYISFLNKADVEQTYGVTGLPHSTRGKVRLLESLVARKGSYVLTPRAITLIKFQICRSW